MTNPNQTYRIEDLAKATAYDNAGDKLGSVKDVYINDATGQPDFVDVNHGLFNMNDSIVPLRGHSLRDGELHLAFSKDRIKDAPELGENGHLTNEDQDAFYRHYGLENVENTARYGVANENAGRHAADERNAAAGRDRDRTNATAGDDATMVRSEERLNVDKERQATGRVSLRKYVEHDTETVEVPVEREEVRVEREPISEAEAANLRGQDLGNDEASVTLHEEKVNVSKESVPVEKVSLDKETVRGTETVSEDVAKERIETEGVDNEDKRDRR